MKTYIFGILAFLSVQAFSQKNLIPQPQQLEIRSGSIPLAKKIKVSGSAGKKELDVLNSFLKPSAFTLLGGSAKDAAVTVKKISNSRQDYYALETGADKKIKISYTSDRSRFYAFQTLIQLLIEHETDQQLPHLKIQDYPKYQWRGMHLDVCRHFFTKDEVKQYIDYLAMYKLNTFHWHLTDDQGWRIEIKKYPKLTEHGAWRSGSMVGPYSDHKYDDIRYGGFYTQDEIREVVKYAQDRHITVVPEIEMPGHAVAAISSYPWLSCTGKQIPVERGWGVYEDIFCPKEETFEFLENVLSEVIALFPSKVIHIGGDEAPKTRWKECPHCQALIKKEGLKDEHELQSYFIRRIEKFLNAKGREIIGWDEILEGGLAPNAKVMSWRGTEGGLTAASQQHDVVMTPGEYMYFDHYQGDPQNEPLAFGGFLPLEKVYSYNPVPAGLKPENHKYILGAQANIWTEYINDFKQVQYMAFPRITALSEVDWGTSNPKNYNAFQKKVFQHMKWYDRKGINYARSVFNVTSTSLPANNGKDAVIYALKGFNGTQGIYYTTDGSEPTLNSNKYSAPFAINSNTTVKAAYFEDGKPMSKIMQQKVLISKSTGKTIILQTDPSKKYFGNGAATLVDGLRGDTAKFGKDWLGFDGKDMVATIDFPVATEISSLDINFVKATSSWVHLPKSVKIKIAETGKTYEATREQIEKANGVLHLEFPKTFTKKITVTAENLGNIPSGFDGEGNPAWLFVDEISIH